jgi:glucan 1,3-beta-glucosidase
MRGVNLGNWLVLEKWMSPGLFEGTDAEDEANLCLQLDDVVKHERYKLHRDSFVTDRDFAYLANHGLELIRLPVPYFVFGDVAPYVGCIEYVDRALGWAEKHGLQILLDLHTVPGSQNGFDNGGICGVCKFNQDPDNVEVALDVLGRLAARHRESAALWGIEGLNEPISPEMWELVDVPNRYRAADPEQAAGSGPMPTDFLKDYYRRAYDRIRQVAPDVRVVFHDGFRIREWVGFLQEPHFTNFVVDSHRYMMSFALEKRRHGKLDELIAYTRDEVAPTLREVSQHFPVMVGEWSLDAVTPAPHALPPDERRTYFRTLAAAQLDAWGPYVVAWTYWSYKMLIDTPASEVWDMGKAIELGLFPTDVAS